MAQHVALGVLRDGFPKMRAHATEGVRLLLQRQAHRVEAADEGQAAPVLEVPADGLQARAQGGQLEVFGCHRHQVGLGRKCTLDGLVHLLLLTLRQFVDPIGALLQVSAIPTLLVVEKGQRLGCFGDGRWGHG